MNKLIKSTPLLLLPVMGGAMAADISVPLSFTTLPVITITEIRPLVFGDVLSLTQAATCEMSTSAGTALTPAQEGADLTNGTLYPTATPSAQSAGQLSNGCTGDDGQVGIYQIRSFSNANISVSVTAGTPTDISFAPAGYVTSLIEAGAATRETLNGTGVVANASQALSAFAPAGTNRAIVGGTITNQVGLTAGTAYTTDFNLNVVYQ